MTKSFGMLVIVAPLLIVAWMLVLVDVFKYARYRRQHKGERAGSFIGDNEEPVLILEFNNKPEIIKMSLLVIIFFALCLFVFFIADYLARHDTYSLFLFLNKEQTYILYFWTWKIVPLITILLFALQTTHFFNKRVLFYKKIVILENRIRGRRVLVLNNNVRRTKYAAIECLYDPDNGINIPVFNKKFMKLKSDQQKILDDILSKIPEKKQLLGF